MENSDEWVYRCEGNAGIVISNRKIVLRLVKLPNEDISSKSSQATTAKLKSTVVNQLLFTDNIMRPLMIRNCVVPMRMVSLAQNFAKDVSYKIQHLRPAHRLSKSIPPLLLSAIEMPDLCFLSSENETLSIEIKPKWGYLPATDDVFEVKRHVCRYCMQQAEKVLSGKYQERSLYCPIDLFSGCRKRMSFALLGLMKNPQNNFRVFKNGRIILSEFDGENFEKEVERWMRNCFPSSQDSIEGLLDHLVKMVVECLLQTTHPHLPPSHPPQQCRESKCNHSCTSECSHLPAQSVLSCILNCQRLDEELHLGKMLHHHSNVSNYFSSHIGTREESEIDGPFSSDWMSTCQRAEIKEDIRDIKRFLVARSAKDCSIIVSLAPAWQAMSDDLRCSKHVDVCLVGNNKEVITNVTVIDLDVKKFDKIPFYYEEDIDIVNAYQSQIQNCSFSS